MAGLKSQVLDQSRLKHALVTAFGSIYKTIINAHPNTESLDASGNVVLFGTTLLRAMGVKVVPDDSCSMTSDASLTPTKIRTCAPSLTFC